jgi:hypothetical protein
VHRMAERKSFSIRQKDIVLSPIAWVFCLKWELICYKKAIRLRLNRVFDPKTSIDHIWIKFLMQKYRRRIFEQIFGIYDTTRSHLNQIFGEKIPQKHSWTNFWCKNTAEAYLNQFFYKN